MLKKANEPVEQSRQELQQLEKPSGYWLYRLLVCFQDGRDLSISKFFTLRDL